MFSLLSNRIPGRCSFVSTEMKGNQEIVLNSVKQNFHALEYITSSFLISSGEDIQQSIVNSLKNDTKGREILQKWVLHSKMKGRLKALLEFDRTIADNNYKDGRRVIDRATPEC